MKKQPKKPPATPDLEQLSPACLQQVVGGNTGSLVYLNRSRQKEL